MQTFVTVNHEVVCLCVAGTFEMVVWWLWSLDLSNLTATAHNVCLSLSTPLIILWSMQACDMTMY